MKFSKKLENIKEYNKLFIKNDIKIDYEEFNKYFYIKNFFYNYEMPLLEENFYETTLEICINMLKVMIQELEYFVNVKPNNLIASSDYEIINENSKDVDMYYLKLHKMYKQYIKLHLSGIEKNEEIDQFIIQLHKITKKYIKYSINLQEKLITNINNKISELNKESKELKFEGSVYM